MRQEELQLHHGQNSQVLECSRGGCRMACCSYHILPKTLSDITLRSATLQGFGQIHMRDMLVSGAAADLSSLRWSTRCYLLRSEAVKLSLDQLQSPLKAKECWNILLTALRPMSHGSQHLTTHVSSRILEQPIARWT